MVAAGKLRHRLAIVRPSDPNQTDDYGQPSTIPATVATVWGSVESLSGRELLLAQQVNAETTHRVTLRYRGDVTKDLRILHRGSTLEIESVLDRSGRRIELELLCKETTPGAQA